MIATSGGPPLSTASEKHDGRVQTAATVSAGGESGLGTISSGLEYSSEDVGGIGLAVQKDEAEIFRGADADARMTDVSIAKKEIQEGEDEPASTSSEDYSALSAKIFGLDFTTVSIYPLSNYTFGKKETESRGQEARGVSAEEIRKHRELRFQDRGMRRSVAAILLVHSHSFPHVLLLQRTAGNGGYALPGGRLRPGESAENGLRRKLSAKLSPAHSFADAPEWDIGEQGMSCRINNCRVLRAVLLKYL
jgi:Nucleotide hydrolase